MIIYIKTHDVLNRLGYSTGYCVRYIELQTNEVIIRYNTYGEKTINTPHGEIAFKSSTFVIPHNFDAQRYNVAMEFYNLLKECFNVYNYGWATAKPPFHCNFEDFIIKILFNEPIEPSHITNILKSMSSNVDPNTRFYGCAKNYEEVLKIITKFIELVVKHRFKQARLNSVASRKIRL